MAVERFIAVFEARGLGRMSRDLSRTERHADALRRTMGLLRNALVGIAAARVVGGFTDMVDSVTLLENRMSLLTDTAEQTEAVMQQLFLISQRTRTSLDATGTVFNRLTRASAGTGLTMLELSQITEQLNQLVSISGANAQEASAALIQFSQGLSSGVLSGDELRSVTEQLPALANIIGEEFGVAGGQLRAYAKANEGAITSTRIITALRNAIPGVAEQFENMEVTIGQSFIRFNNALQFFVGGINDATGAGAALARAMGVLAENIHLVVLAAAGLAGAFVLNLAIGQIGILVSNLGHLAKILGVVFIQVTALAIALGSTLATAAARATVGMYAFVTATLTGARVLPTAMASASSSVVASMAAMTAATARFVGVALLSLRRNLVSLAVLLSVSVVQAIRAAAMALATGFVQASALAARSVILLTGRVIALGVAFLANPMVITGAAIIAAVVAAFFALQRTISALIERFGGLRNIFDNVVTALIAGVQTIVRSWDRFPGAVAEISVDAYNQFVDFFIGNVLRGVNWLVRKINETFGTDLTAIDTAFGRIENEFTGNVAAITTTYKSAVSDIESQGGGLAVAGQQWENLTGYLREFTSASMDASEIEAMLAGITPNLGEPGDLTGMSENEVNRLTKAVENLVGSISPMLSATSQLARAQTTLNEAVAQGLDLGMEQDEIMRRLERDYIGIGNAVTDFAEQQALLNSALERGVISAHEFNTAMREARIDFLENQEGQGFFDSMIMQLEVMSLTSETVFNNLGTKVAEIFGPGGSLQTGISRATADALLFGDSFEVGMRRVGQSIVTEVLSSLIRVGLQYGQNFLMKRLFDQKEIASEATKQAQALGIQGAAAASSVAIAAKSGAAIAKAMEPAALATSLATAGANSAGAILGISATKSALAAASTPGFADGVVDLNGPGTGTSDSILARLSAGESVVTADATRQFAPTLRAMNDGTYSGEGTTHQDNRQITFAPQITVQGGGDPEQNAEAIQEAMMEFAIDQQRPGGVFSNSFLGR